MLPVGENTMMSLEYQVLEFNNYLLQMTEKLYIFFPKKKKTVTKFLGCKI